MDSIIRTLEKYDNHDERIRYCPLKMERTLQGLEEIPLPEGYSFRNYIPGDRNNWIQIEKSAREFHTDEDGQKAWERYFTLCTESLAQRMFFVMDAEGRCVATATALYDIDSGDDGKTGWLHWVAVERESQGKGISKPLVTHTLARMHALGYETAVVPTQTTTWLACKVYLDLGFRPTRDSLAKSYRGWQIIRRLTHHPALESIEMAEEDDVMADNDAVCKPFVHRVQYYETDMMGVVHHANYLHWMEEARIDFLNRLGFPYAEMERLGIISPVKGLSCQYLQTCSFPDEIEILTAPESFNGVVLAIRYEMRKRGSGEKVFTAVSEHVFLHRNGGFVRLKRELPDFAAALEKHMITE